MRTQDRDPELWARCVASVDNHYHFEQRFRAAALRHKARLLSATVKGNNMRFTIEIPGSVPLRAMADFLRTAPAGAAVVADAVSAIGGLPGCAWEDCDQVSAYCKGHALELACVGSEREAPTVRRALEAVLRTLAEYERAEADPTAADEQTESAWRQIQTEAGIARQVLNRFPG